MKSDNEKIIEKVISIRCFEESLDDLFSEGEIFGTFHRCIGQEATAVGIISNLDESADYIASTHRNHGHYLAFTEDYYGLIHELKGTKNGVTMGRGGSQVIFGDHFISTGILGSIVGIATGIALGIKRKNLPNCVVCFMGDGGLGEGIVYESLNMASLWSLPILFVLEKNNIAQSTAIDEITSGTIEGRFRAFGLRVERLKSTDVFEIMQFSKKLLLEVKRQVKPAVIIIEADRLCAHSKGDDDRSRDLIEKISANDPLLKLRKYTNRFDKIKKDGYDKIQRIIRKA